MPAEEFTAKYAKSAKVNPADYTAWFWENRLLVNKKTVSCRRKGLRLEGLRLFSEKWRYFELCVGGGWRLWKSLTLN